jgi:hypothetical protein
MRNTFPRGNAFSDSGLRQPPQNGLEKGIARQ